MNILYVTGDATSPQGHGLKIIVHICNDIGVWEKGFVQSLSRRWPEPERHYRAWYRNQEGVPFKLGQVQFIQVAPDTIVANILGQHGLYSQGLMPPIRYEAIRLGLKRVAAYAREHHASIHMPRIDCESAGGTWEALVELIDEELVVHQLPVMIYDSPW